MGSNAAIGKTLRQIAFVIEMIEKEEKEQEGKKMMPIQLRSEHISEDLMPLQVYHQMSKIYRSRFKGIIKIPSVGKAIASKIVEYISQQ
jgi:hypothetical protein